MTDPIELLASYWTIAGGALPHTDRDYSPFDFKDRVESAARAGFKGFGIWHTDLEHTLQKRSLREMKQILDDNGMQHVELEFLYDWFMEGERKKQSDIWKQKLLAAAEVLEAKHIKVGDFFREKVAMPHLIEAFAALCAEAAEHGTRIGFELMPFAMIDTLRDSLTMVEGVGAKNGGIILDLWHIVKLNTPYDEVARVPAQYIVGVELNDGTFQAPWDLHEDTINHRRFCGEGEFDIRSFIASVRKTGYQGPWGIEVLSEELRKMPLDELTGRAFNTTMRQFAG
ncbi:MAG: sugar phosphate isomerase/epimerase [Acidobacteriia bacterium]|nr:sugar phosphate isomerase/epimerase [Terriglobia bacterium]